MLTYEFNGIDVVKDVMRWQQETINENRSNINEEIDKDKVDFLSFLPTITSYSLDQNNLHPGKKYFPLLVSVLYRVKRISLWVTITEIEFIRDTGSRLEFVTKDNKSILYPSDDALQDNWFRLVFLSKEHIDQSVQNIILRFKGTDWSIVAQGYDSDGKLHPVSNI